MGSFFFSHAPADARGYLDQFHDDFAEELRAQLGLNTAAGIGFRGRGTLPDDGLWPADVALALRTSPAFLAMVSPTYLQHEGCQKEWAAFEWRMQHYGGGAADTLVPILWLPPDPPLPPAIASRHGDGQWLGKTYAAEGMRAVVDEGGHQYRRVLTALAKRVRQIVQADALGEPTALPARSVLGDPFGARKPTGPRHVEFLVLAADPAALPAIRTIRASYAARPNDWRPYLPDHDERIEVTIDGVAGAEHMTYGLPPLAEDIVGYLTAARHDNTIAMLVIDVWSLDAYQDFLVQVDGHRFLNAAVLVVWNPADGETAAHRQALLDALGRSFPNLIVVKDPPAFHEEITNYDQLRGALASTLRDVGVRIKARGTVHRRPDGRGPAAPPILPGPGTSG